MCWNRSIQNNDGELSVLWCFKQHPSFTIWISKTRVKLEETHSTQILISFQAKFQLILPGRTSLILKRKLKDKKITSSSRTYLADHLHYKMRFQLHGVFVFMKTSKVLLGTFLFFFHFMGGIIRKDKSSTNNKQNFVDEVYNQYSY